MLTCRSASVDWLPLTGSELMQSSENANFNNSFFRRLERLTTSNLREVVSPKYLSVSQTVFADADVVDRIIFPVEAIVSVELCLDGSSCTELTTIGREGFFGISPVAGTDLVSGQYVVRQAGNVLEMSLDTFGNLLQGNAKIKRLCDRYALYQMLNISQRAACRQTHTKLQRLCQKILVWDARNGGHHRFDMTHQILAEMLGNNRSTISEHARRLQSQGIIRYTHGRVEVLDHKKLMGKSCRCFDVMRIAYLQLINDSELRDDHLFY